MALAKNKYLSNRFDQVAPAQVSDRHYKIRLAKPDEIDKVKDLDTAAFGRAADEAALNLRHFHIEDSFRSKSTRILVAQDAATGTLGGFVFVQLRSSSGDRRVAEVTELAVDPAIKRRGLGRKLMDAAEKIAFDAGLKEMRLHVHESNRSARGLYEKMSYRVQETGAAERYLDGTVAVEMTKPLAPVPGTGLIQSLLFRAGLASRY